MAKENSLLSWLKTAQNVAISEHDEEMTAAATALIDMYKSKHELFEKVEMKHNAITYRNEKFVRRATCRESEIPVMIAAELSDAAAKLIGVIMTVAVRQYVQLSTDDLCNMTHWSRRKVSAAMKELREAGVLLTYKPARGRVAAIYKISTAIMRVGKSRPNGRDENEIADATTRTVAQLLASGKSPEDCGMPIKAYDTEKLTDLIDAIKTSRLVDTKNVTSYITDDDGHTTAKTVQVAYMRHGGNDAPKE